MAETSKSCPIYLDELNSNEATYLACMHAFCSVCISKWLAKSDTCPVCRQRQEPERLQSRLSDALVLRFVEDPEANLSEMTDALGDLESLVPDSPVIMMHNDGILGLREATNEFLSWSIRPQETLQEKTYCYTALAQDTVQLRDSLTPRSVFASPEEIFPHSSCRVSNEPGTCRLPSMTWHFDVCIIGTCRSGRTTKLREMLVSSTATHRIYSAVTFSSFLYPRLVCRTFRSAIHADLHATITTALITDITTAHLFDPDETYSVDVFVDDADLYEKEQNSSDDIHETLSKLKRMDYVDEVRLVCCMHEDNYIRGIDKRQQPCVTPNI